jgi:hypothetical protein
MKTLLETKEKNDKEFLEKELNELMEVTFKMEYELEIALQEAKSKE